MFGMHKIAVASSIALTFTILATLGLSKVCDGRELCADYTFGVVTAVKAFHCSTTLLFILKLDIDIPYHVVSDVVSHNHLLNLPIFAQFHEYFFIEVLEVVHRLHEGLLLHLVTICKSNGRGRVLVDVRQNHGLTQGRLVV